MASGDEVRIDNPLLSGHGPGIDSLRTDCANLISSRLISEVQRNLDTSLKHPTPYYETQIVLTQLSTTDRSVNDRGVIYGAWLEGVSSRNRSTRFHGYHCFQRAHQRVQEQVEDLIEPAIRRFIAGNGG